MSIANSTQHFHFPLVVGTDRPIFGDYNETMETLDEELYDAVSTLSVIPDEITDLQTAANAHAEDIAALQRYDETQDGINTLVSNSILSLQQAVEAIPTKLNAVAIADAYDTTKTYTIGDYVTYQSNLYKCKVAVTTGEQIDAYKWDGVDVMAEVDELKDAIVSGAIIGEVTGDGVKTTSQLLDELYALVSDKLTDTCFIDFNGVKHSLQSKETKKFTLSIMSTTNVRTYSIELAANGSKRETAYVDTDGFHYQDVSSTVIANGAKISLRY